MMSGIRSRSTRPKMQVRRALFERGCRYRLHCLAALAPVGHRAALVLGVKNHQGKISWGSTAELQLCDELSLRFVQTLDELRSMCGSKP